MRKLTAALLWLSISAMCQAAEWKDVVEAHTEVKIESRLYEKRYPADTSAPHPIWPTIKCYEVFRHYKVTYLVGKYEGRPFQFELKTEETDDKEEVSPCSLSVLTSVSN